MARSPSICPMWLQAAGEGENRAGNLFNIQQLSECSQLRYISECRKFANELFAGRFLKGLVVYMGGWVGDMG